MSSESFSAVQINDFICSLGSIVLIFINSCIGATFSYTNEKEQVCFVVKHEVVFSFADNFI